MKPTHTAALIFQGKAALLRVRRSAQNFLGTRPGHHARGEKLSAAPILAESVTPLWTENAAAEQFLQAGKVHNLRLAIRRLHGVEIAAHGLFSYWAQVGRASRWKGYVRGRELREGCLIPNIGGGLCQLSNALYDAASKAGFEIVERHAHTQVVPGSLAESGRDATVFWNYVDLRWRPPQACRIEASMDRNFLTVRLRGAMPGISQPASQPRAVAKGFTSTPNSCATCGVEECFRHLEPPDDSTPFGRCAVLVDKCWPEFEAYLRGIKRDLLCLPIDGKKFGKANYAWNTNDFRKVRSWPVATMLRGWTSRKLARQGAERQRFLLSQAGKLARRYASALAFDVTEVVVMQNLLPFLWREGHLGGRAFDVLMTALPIAALQSRLDAAAALHPDSPTLRDFRADEWLVAAESEALDHARKIITPHREIVALFPGRAELLDWKIPLGKSRIPLGRKIVFPASALARKGAYEMREAARRLGLELIVVGDSLEAPDFWRGVPVEFRCGSDWLQDAAAVVLPAFVEHEPRRLLEALASGVPVIASPACGLHGMAGVATIPAGDVDALCAAIEKATAHSLAAA